MEIVDSIKSYLYDRIKSPLYGTFIVTWCLWNWKIFYLTFFVSESVVGNKMWYVGAYLTDFNRTIKYPIFSTLVLIIIAPLLSIGAYWFVLKYKQLRNMVEGTRLLSLEESTEILFRVDQEKEENLKRIQGKDSEIARNSNTINSLIEKLGRFEDQLKGLRILKAEYGVLGTSDLVDVTQKLNDNIRNGSLNFTVSNDLFGDPKAGYGKQLSLIWVSNGIYDYRIFNEGENTIIPTSPTMKDFTVK
jgi:hypothetical protein